MKIDQADMKVDQVKVVKFSPIFACCCFFFSLKHQRKMYHNYCENLINRDDDALGEVD